ncbi:MAG: hypothetical protein K2M08_00225 [Anaeroplasmataceae bacterium]|nr:hypothetical protein [Anaeroplasmataceae bacterium]
MKLSKKYKVMISLLITVLILVHLGSIIYCLVPRTLYSSVGKVNFVSLTLCILLVITVFVGLNKKNSKVIYYCLVIQYFLLIPSIFIGILFTHPLEKGSTDDFKNYLVMDDKKTTLDVQSYFPLEVEEAQVEWYRYYYMDSIFPGIDNVTEVSLKIKPNETEFESILSDLKERFPNATYQTFIYNTNYQEISFVDEFDYQHSSKHAIVKKILYNEKDKTIIYEYIYSINGLASSEYKDLYYVSKIT